MRDGRGHREGDLRRLPGGVLGGSANCERDPAKLGTISGAEIHLGGHALWVVNAYPQLDYRGAGVPVPPAGALVATSPRDRRQSRHDACTSPRTMTGGTGLWWQAR